MLSVKFQKRNLWWTIENSSTLENFVSFFYGFSVVRDPQNHEGLTPQHNFKTYFQSISIFSLPKHNYCYFTWFEMKLLKGFFDIISILVFYVCPISGAGSECSLADFAKDLGDSLTFTTRDGIELQVVVKGRQRHPTILFLHGFPDCWLSWKNQIPFFVNRGYRTAALSLRGYAESDKPKGRAEFFESKKKHKSNCKNCDVKGLEKLR